MPNLLDLAPFREAEAAVRSLRRRLSYHRRKLRKLRRLQEQGTSGGLSARIDHTEEYVATLETELHTNLATVAEFANAAFEDLPLLNSLLRHLNLPEALSPDDAVRALKKAKIHINIYDVVSGEFKPIYATVEELAASIARDKRIFPLEMAKASALKLFLRKIRRFM